MSHLTPERNDIPYIFSNEPKGYKEWTKSILLFIVVMIILMCIGLVIGSFYDTNTSDSGEIEPPASWSSGVYSD